MFRTFVTAVALLVTTPAFAAFESDRISVTTQGTGPDVVLVHGLASAARVWTGTTERVPGFRYHLVQIAGMGGAAPGGNAQGAVVGVLENRQIGRCVQRELPTLLGGVLPIFLCRFERRLQHVVGYARHFGRIGDDVRKCIGRVEEIVGEARGQLR